jgi:hypothetical protein
VLASATHRRPIDAPSTPSGAGQLEIRGAAAIGVKDPAPPNEGFAAFGDLGFNSPSLLGMSLSAPYFHDGSAATLEAVFQKHLLPKANQTIATELSAQQETDLLTFLRSIDDATPPFQSDADVFPRPQR